MCLITDVFNNRCHGCQGDGSFDNLTGCNCPGVRGTVLFPGHGWPCVSEREISLCYFQTWVTSDIWPRNIAMLFPDIGDLWHLASKYRYAISRHRWPCVSEREISLCFFSDMGDLRHLDMKYRYSISRHGWPCVSEREISLCFLLDIGDLWHMSPKYRYAFSRT